MARFIQIDEDGYFVSSGLRVADETYGHALLSQLQEKNRGFITQSDGHEIIVEAFDQPLISLPVRPGPKIGSDLGSTPQWPLQFPYGYTSTFDPHTLCTDDWDRFHGRTINNLPFVFSRSAQIDFFNLLEKFDDDAIYVDGKKILIPTINDREVAEAKLSYHGPTPNWAFYFDDVAKPLREILPQIKIPRSRICILGCRTGHDAAYFASQGHLVTAVDLNPLAIARAREQHRETPNLKFIEADAFAYAKKSSQQFDIIFEHAFFSAIAPNRRSELVQAWRSLLIEGGHLLGIFFILDRLGSPPYGVTEWELKKHLQNDFAFLYWTRWKTSLEARLGKELVIYARKKERSTRD